MRLDEAYAIVRHVVDGADAPVSVYVTDERGEVASAGLEPGAV